jgi:asparagine synthase (glutamine-hydrolysing)
MLRRARRECDQSSNLPPRIAILNPDFVQHVRLRERYKESRQYQPSTAENEREAHFRAVTHSIQPTALEVLDRAAMAFSIEPRYPFWDKRLVEFCLSLPPEQKLNRGWSRIVLRRAMDGILPVEIQWRRGKTNFLPSFSHRLLTYERKRLDELILSGSKVIEQYVNITALHKMYHRYVSHELEEKPQEVLAIWRAASLALWLNNAGLNELQSVERR